MSALLGTPIPGLAERVARLDMPSAEAVAALVRPVMEDTRWFDALIARLARDAVAEPDGAPPFAALSGGMQAGLVLHADARFVLHAGVADRGALAAKRMGARAGAIVFTGQLGLIRVLSGGGATLSLWTGGWRDTRPAAVCAHAGTRRLIDGETFAVDGRDTAYLVEHAHRDFVLLQATIAAGAAPAACEYDHATGALVGLGATRDATSRRQMLATLLAELDLPESHAFDAASRMPEAYARWHVMRQWLRADADGAAPRLAEMAARDPDGEVRGLAAATLPCLA